MQRIMAYIFALISMSTIAVAPAFGCKELYIYIDFSGSMNQPVVTDPSTGKTEPAIAVVSSTLQAALSEERPFEIEGCEEVTIFRFDSKVYDGPGETVKFDRLAGDSALSENIENFRKRWPLSDTYTDIAAVLKHIGSIVEDDQGRNGRLFVIASDFAHDIDSAGSSADKDVKEFKRKISSFQEAKAGFSNPYRDMLFCLFVQNQDPQNDYRRQTITREIGWVIGEDMLFDSALFTGEDFRKKIGRFFAPVSLSIARAASGDGYEIVVSNHTSQVIELFRITVDCPRKPKGEVKGALETVQWKLSLKGHATSEPVLMLDADHPVLVATARGLGAGERIRCDVEFEGTGPGEEKPRPLTGGGHSLYLGTFIELELASAKPVIKLGDPVVIEALVRLQGQLADPARGWPDLHLTLSSRKPIGDIELAERILSPRDQDKKEAERSLKAFAKIRPDAWHYQTIYFSMNEASAWASLCTHDRSALVLKAVAKAGEVGQAEDENVFPGLRDESIISEGRDAHSLIEKVLIPLLGAFAAVSLLIIIYPRPLLERLEVALAVFGLVITTLLILVHDVFPRLTNKLEGLMAADVPRTASVIFCFLTLVFIVGYIRGLHRHPLSEQAIRDIVKAPTTLKAHLELSRIYKFAIPLAAVMISVGVSLYLAFVVPDFSVCVFKQGYVPDLVDPAESR